jgi:hypothetical protein
VIWITLAVIALAFATGEIAYRLTVPRAFMLTGLFWGLVFASALHHLTPWGLAGVVVAASLIVASWCTFRERRPV